MSLELQLSLGLSKIDQNLDHNQKIIELSPEGRIVSDSGVVNLALKIFDTDHLIIGQELTLMVIQVLIKKKFLNYKKMVLRHNGTDYRFNKESKCEIYQSQGLTLYDDLLTMLVGWDD